MKHTLYMFWILGLIFLDALTKFWAETSLESRISLIPSFFSLQYAQNTGIAFSIPLTGIVLKILTVILIFGIIWYYVHEEKKKNSGVLKISYSLILAGALGNAWERIFRWYVTDFISVEYFSIFNLADSYITLGAIGIIYFYYFSDKKSCQTDQET